MAQYAAVPIELANEMLRYLLTRPMVEAERFVTTLRTAQILNVEEAPSLPTGEGVAAPLHSVVGDENE